MFCCVFRYLNAVTIKDAYPIPRHDKSLSKLWGREVLHDVRFGLCGLASATQKARSGENGLCVPAGIVTVEEDAVRLVQRDGHIPATDGPGIHECNQ